MARYTGPKDKLSRRFGVPLFGATKALEHKNYPPGMHGPKGSRRKQSEYAVALAEKQKLRFQYGLLERQFRRYFEIASRKRGVTGELLLQMLESRLDNVVFRLGFANSRSAARQLVGHGHVQVNGRKVNVPSFAVKPGNTITVKDTPKSRSLAARNLGTHADHSRSGLARARQGSLYGNGLPDSDPRRDRPDRQRAVDRRALLALGVFSLSAVRRILFAGDPPSSFYGLAASAFFRAVNSCARIAAARSAAPPSPSWLTTAASACCSLWRHATSVSNLSR